MPHEGQMGVHFLSDGNRLLGTLFLAENDDPKPTAILLHGVPGIEKNYDIALMLRDRGWNALLMHYRGCWGSEGLYEFKKLPDDVRAALDYLESGQHPQIDVNKIVLIGHSMGGWTSLLTAPQEPRIKAFIVYGAVCNPQQLDFSIEEIIESFTAWLPGLEPEAFQTQWRELGDDFTPTAQVQRVQQPALIIHGEQDEVVPIQQAYDLQKQAPPNLEFNIHAKANHSFSWHRPWLLEVIWAWLEKLF